MARPPKPALTQRCRTHNTRFDPDAGVIDVPGSGALNEWGSAEGVDRVEQEFSCGCAVTSTLNRQTGSFDITERNERGERV
jgi:hypothetical protein